MLCILVCSVQGTWKYQPLQRLLVASLLSLTGIIDAWPHIKTWPQIRKTYGDTAWLSHWLSSQGHETGTVCGSGSIIIDDIWLYVHICSICSVVLMQPKHGIQVSYWWCLHKHVQIHKQDSSMLYARDRRLWIMIFYIFLSVWIYWYVLICVSHVLWMPQIYSEGICPTSSNCLARKGHSLLPCSGFVVSNRVATLGGANGAKPCNQWAQAFWHDLQMCIDVHLSNFKEPISFLCIFWPKIRPVWCKETCSQTSSHQGRKDRNVLEHA